jgi:hypothetical protein
MNEVININQKDQPVCSESRIEALSSAVSKIESIHVDFIRASEINDKIYKIICDEKDSPFPGRDIFDSFDDLYKLACSKLTRIKELSGCYQLTKHELPSYLDEIREPENQSPFGADAPSFSEIMEDI